MMWRNNYSRRTRLGPTFNSWWDMNRFQREMGFRLGGTTGPINRAFPALNAWTGDEGVVVRAELPGFDAKDVEIKVKGKTVTISGTYEAAAETDGVNYYRRERRNKDFSRVMELPFRVDEDKVEASLSQGILEIKVARRPEERPKTISVISK